MREYGETGGYGLGLSITTHDICTCNFHLDSAQRLQAINCAFCQVIRDCTGSQRCGFQPNSGRKLRGASMGSLVTHFHPAARTDRVRELCLDFMVEVLMIPFRCEKII